MTLRGPYTFGICLILPSGGEIIYKMHEILEQALGAYYLIPSCQQPYA